MTAPAPDITPAEVNDPDVFHWVCCDPATAICGTDVSNIPFSGPHPDEMICAVCDDLLTTPCTRCGSVV